MASLFSRLFQRAAQPDDFAFAAHEDLQRDISLLEDTQERVDVADILSIPAAWQATTDIAEKIASLNLRVYRLMPDGTKDYLDGHFVIDMLSYGNAYQSGYDVRRTQALHLCIEGNSFSEIVPRAEGGFSIATIEPERVSLSVVNGEKIFTIDDGADTGGIDRFFHIAGPSYRGLLGMSPRNLHARTFSTAIELDKYVFDYANNSRRPPLKVTMATRASYDAVVKFIKNTLGKVLRTKGQPVIPLMPNTDIEEFARPSDSATLNETRNEVNVKDMGRIFDTPSSRLGNTDAATYNNVLQDTVRYIRGTIAQKARNIEMAYKNHFLEPDEFLEHDIEPLLQGEFKDMVELYERLVDMGAILPEQVAAELDLGGLDDVDDEPGD